MAQIKIYGIKEKLIPVRERLSEIIHEICIQESPACNWGFRGMHGDEVKLNYKINV